MNKTEKQQKNQKEKKNAYNLEKWQENILKGIPYISLAPLPYENNKVNPGFSKFSKIPPSDSSAVLL